MILADAVDRQKGRARNYWLPRIGFAAKPATPLRGTWATVDRRLIGPYARLGFGKWGILVEHDVTDRSSNNGSFAAFRQNASYGQVFWAPREWLVASLIGERLQVERPFAERIRAGRLEVTARLASQVTVG